MSLSETRGKTLGCGIVGKASAGDRCVVSIDTDSKEVSTFRSATRERGGTGVVS